jgi:hypothetical protein
MLPVQVLDRVESLPLIRVPQRTHIPPTKGRERPRSLIERREKRTTARGNFAV